MSRKMLFCVIVMAVLLSSQICQKTTASTTTDVRRRPPHQLQQSNETVQLVPCNHDGGEEVPSQVLLSVSIDDGSASDDQDTFGTTELQTKAAHTRRLMRKRWKGEDGVTEYGQPYDFRSMYESPSVEESSTDPPDLMEHAVSEPPPATPVNPSPSNSCSTQRRQVVSSALSTQTEGAVTSATLDDQIAAIHVKLLLNNSASAPKLAIPFSGNCITGSTEKLKLCLGSLHDTKTLCLTATDKLPCPWPPATSAYEGLSDEFNIDGSWLTVVVFSLTHGDAKFNDRDHPDVIANFAELTVNRGGIERPWAPKYPKSKDCVISLNCTPFKMFGTLMNVRRLAYVLDRSDVTDGDEQSKNKGGEQNTERPAYADECKVRLSLPSSRLYKWLGEDSNYFKLFFEVGCFGKTTNRFIFEKVCASSSKGGICALRALVKNEDRNGPKVNLEHVEELNIPDGSLTLDILIRRSFVSDDDIGVVYSALSHNSVWDISNNCRTELKISPETSGTLVSLPRHDLK
eukprot:GHVS01026220.1.p1 GENE.GHVS01026220.1~~GHVS01026220.1.p1  ORF type:complete len:515 (-),score=48.29 GHVS01026220.1:656-2200(-)